MVTTDSNTQHQVQDEGASKMLTGFDQPVTMFTQFWLNLIRLYRLVHALPRSSVEFAIQES